MFEINIPPVEIKNNTHVVRERENKLGRIERK